MSGRKGRNKGPVGRLNEKSRQQQPAPKQQAQPQPQPKPQPPKEPTARTLSWTLKPEWTVGETITLDGLQAAASAGPKNIVLTAPASPALTKAADKLAVTITAAAADGFAAATLSGEVKVVKLVPKIAWKTPLPVMVNTELGPAQLNAAMTPGTLKPAYSPAAKTKMAKAGKQTLQANFAGDEGHEAVSASVVLTVAATQNELVGATGTVKTLNGDSFVKPTSGKAKALLDKWDKDEGGIKTQAKKIMGDIQSMTADELLDYMDKLVTDPNDKLVQDKNKNGNPATYPNTIWKLPNGLQVRYKPKGDGKDGTTNPMFCIEGRTSDGFSGSQDDIAFKVMSNGEAGPKGPGQTGGATYGTKVLNDAYMSAACGTTHLKCAPKLTQTITWADPADIDVDTALSATQLNATALGEVAVTYERAGKAIKAGDKLPGGAQTLVAKAAETKKYLAATKSVTINVKRKPQQMTWAAPADIFPDTPLGPTQLNATRLGEAPLTYWHSGNEIKPGSKLPAGEARRLLAKAAATDQHDAGETSVTINVRKRPQTVTWANPADITVGAKLTRAQLNATALGNAPVTYRNASGGAVKAGDALPVGDGQVLTAVAAATAVYAEGQATATINVKPAAPPPQGGGKKGGGNQGGNRRGGRRKG